MNLLRAVYKAKKSYEKLDHIRKLEVTKVVTGAVRMERVILNSNTPDRRGDG